MIEPTPELLAACADFLGEHTIQTKAPIDGWGLLLSITSLELAAFVQAREQAAYEQGYCKIIGETDALKEPRE